MEQVHHPQEIIAGSPLELINNGSAQCVTLNIDALRDLLALQPISGSGSGNGGNGDIVLNAGPVVTGFVCIDDIKYAVVVDLIQFEDAAIAFENERLIPDGPCVVVTDVCPIFDYFGLVDGVLTESVVDFDSALRKQNGVTVEYTDLDGNATCETDPADCCSGPPDPCGDSRCIPEVIAANSKSFFSPPGSNYAVTPDHVVVGDSGSFSGYIFGTDPPDGTSCIGGYDVSMFNLLLYPDALTNSAILRITNTKIRLTGDPTFPSDDPYVGFGPTQLSASYSLVTLPDGDSGTCPASIDALHAPMVGPLASATMNSLVPTDADGYVTDWTVGPNIDICLGGQQDCQSIFLCMGLEITGVFGEPCCIKFTLTFDWEIVDEVCP